jgi:predicted MFS family arabinose efflux permease
MSSILFEKKRVNVNSIRARITAILVSLCTIACFINMPVILGLAGKDLSLQGEQVWSLAATFVGGLVLASVLSTLFIRVAHWQRLVMISGFFATLAFLAPTLVDGFTFLLVCMGFAGFLTGVGYVVSLACLGDTENPTRNYAVAFGCQILVMAMVSDQVPAWIARGVGFESALMVLAGLAFLSILLGKLMPGSGKRASLMNAMTSQKPIAVFVGLVVLLLVFLGGSTIRGSIEPIASKADMASHGGTMMLTLLLVGAAGSFVAALLGDRYGYVKPMVAAMGISVVVLLMGVAQMWPDQLGFVTAICLVVWAWNFGAPYALGLVAKLDSNGRFTPLIATMQALGGIGGTLAVGLLAVGNNHVGPYLFASATWIIALLIFILVVKNNQKTLSAE